VGFCNKISAEGFVSEIAWDPLNAVAFLGDKVC
jgi:hypothetical protein